MQHIKASILLVEDDPDLCETMVESLAIYGIAAIPVASGREFFRVLDEQRYAAAIIDLGLPDLNGYELIGYLRQNTDLKIIVVTARSAMSDRIRGYANGADLYLTKPVQIEELAAAVLSIATRRQVALSPESWYLDRVSMKLCGPDGQHFLLGSREFRLLALLGAAGGMDVRRNAVLAAVYESADDTKSRALDVLISRLRSRYLEATGISLPLITITGVGFRFTATLSVN